MSVAEHGRNGFVAIAFANCNRDGALALKAARQRRMSAERRLLHDHEAAALEVAHDALRGNGGHVFVGVVFSLATLKPEREGDRIGEVRGVGGRELVGVGHGRP